jgi:hypothetical protein
VFQYVKEKAAMATEVNGDQQQRRKHYLTIMEWAATVTATT